MNKYLYHFTQITPKHYLDLFDKLIKPILNYGSEVWDFVNDDAIEGVHLQFCKTMLGVKRTTQNDFVYGELGRCNLRTQRFSSTIKNWFKILMSEDNKYIKGIYTMMLHDLDIQPNKPKLGCLRLGLS